MKKLIFVLLAIVAVLILLISPLDLTRTSNPNSNPVTTTYLINNEVTNSQPHSVSGYELINNKELKINFQAGNESCYPTHKVEVEAAETTAVVTLYLGTLAPGRVCTAELIPRSVTITLVNEVAANFEFVDSTTILYTA